MLGCPAPKGSWDLVVEAATIPVPLTSPLHCPVPPPPHPNWAYQGLGLLEQYLFHLHALGPDTGLALSQFKPYSVVDMFLGTSATPLAGGTHKLPVITGSGLGLN